MTPTEKLLWAVTLFIILVQWHDIVLGCLFQSSGSRTKRQRHNFIRDIIDKRRLAHQDGYRILSEAQEEQLEEKVLLRDKLWPIDNGTAFDTTPIDTTHSSNMRLKHLAKKNTRRGRRAQRMLEHTPERASDLVFYSVANCRYVWGAF